MVKEINLLSKYPKSKRNLDERNTNKSEQNVLIVINLVKNFLMVKENMDMEDCHIIQNIGLRL